VLNYGLTTKLYLSRLSRSYSESENPNLTRQVQPLTEQVRSGVPPNKSGPFTGQVRSPGYKTPLSQFFNPHSTLFFSLLLPPMTKDDSKVIWGSPLLLESSLHRICSGSRYILSVPHAIYDSFQTMKYIVIPFDPKPPSMP
jgi:hypothetical protein